MLRLLAVLILPASLISAVVAVANLQMVALLVSVALAVAGWMVVLSASKRLRSRL
jgi:hypothetical protein